MKVLFLDIDGVVNKKENFNPTNKDTLYALDTYCAFLVGRIQLQTGCKVVLSSSWRHNPEGVKSVSERVVPLYDKTPTLDRSTRGEEIQAWLEQHSDVDKYAILDDDSDMLDSQKDNFFQTTFDDGLTDEIAQAVIEHLGAE